jgi:hypothetical protein
MEAVPSQTCDFVAAKMAAHWQPDLPFFVDHVLYPDDPVTLKGEKAHPLRHCIDLAALKGLRAIPVTGSGRSPEYQVAVRDIAKTYKHGVAVRLIPVDFEDETNLKDTLDALTDLHKVGRHQMDIIVDFGSVASSKAATVTAEYRANLSLLPNINDWRTLTVAGGAFPLSLQPLTRGAWNPAARSDWQGWKALVTGTRKPERLPAYGDYGISHPGLPPEGRATILAQLRYCTPETFLIWKGYNVFKHRDRYKQFFGICADMAKRPEFRGTAFSDGDAEIASKAAKHGTAGNAETWRKIALNHHVETVIDQLASLP